MTTKIPKDLNYSNEHEWASLENNIVTIGITDFAQSSLGDIVFVELPKVGSELKLGATFGVVESIKSVSDLYSPVTGKVVACNNEVESQPELVNNDPYSAWLVKLEVPNNTEFNKMLNADQYGAICNQN